MPLEFLYDSGGVLAVAKPAGLPTQAPPGIESVESLARERLFGPAKGQSAGSPRRRHPGGFLGVPHRLDRGVSGVLLLATTPRACRQLSRQFERRQVRKTYLAIALPTPAAGPAVGTRFEWRDAIRKVPDEPRAEIVPPDAADGREAVTTGRVVATDVAGRLLLELEPLTGRMHQLRVQAAARGLPILGDPLYGPTPSAESATQNRLAAIALHAVRITFRDPDTGVEETVTCPPPAVPPWPNLLAAQPTA